MSATVASYIAAQPPDIAHILEQVREIILAAAPGATEAIGYGMPVFRLETGHIFYLGAWKAHFALYPVYPQAPALEAELTSRRSGKDTLKFKYRDPVPLDLIARLVEARVATLRGKSSA